MIKKILAPTDLSSFSRAGVRYALNKARANGAEVIIYHVFKVEDLRRLGERLTDHAIRAAASSSLLQDHLRTCEGNLATYLEKNFADLLPLVEVRKKVEFGTPDKNIVSLAETEQVDLIIMASRGRRGLRRMIFGSVTEQVIRNAPCPVIAVPRPRTKPVELCPRRRKTERDAVKRGRTGRPSQVDRRIAERHH
jgi:nucleotide-binding universal stress UspA family protein